MKTVIKKGLSAEIFADIYEFSEALKRPVNNVFAEYADRLGSDDSNAHRGGKYFMSENFAEADGLMQNGYEVGVRQLMAAPSFVNEAKQPRTQLSAVGFAPHVPNAIIGAPLSMITKEQVKAPTPVVRIVYNNVVGFDVDYPRIVASSRKVLDVIATLERRGIRVELHVCMMSRPVRHDDFTYMVSVCIKEAMRPLNLLKVAYPLVHPSFLRRHMLRWVETSPIIKNSEMTDGYGFPKQDKATAVESGVIRQNDVFLSFRDVNDVPVENIIENLKNQTKLTLKN